MLVLLLFDEARARVVSTLGRAADGIRRAPTIFVVVLGKHNMQSVVYNSWELRVLDEGDLVHMLGLITPHQQILVKVLEVGLQFALDELGIDICIVVLELNEIFQIEIWFALVHFLIIY